MVTGIGELSENEYARISAFEIIGYAAVNAAGIAFVVFIGLLVSRRGGFEILKDDFIPSILIPILIGIFLAVFATGLDVLWYQGAVLTKVRGMGGIIARLSVVYAAAVGEEILFRFFLMSLIAWISALKIRSATAVAWIGIIVSGLFFGMGHFPKDLAEISLMVMGRALLLNGFAGIVFGWLYWKRGLATAMIAHFSADFTIYFILPFGLNVLEIG